MFIFMAIAIAELTGMDGDNIVIIYRGMDLLRRVENWAAPYVLVVTLGLLVWAVKGMPLALVILLSLLLGVVFASLSGPTHT